MRYIINYIRQVFCKHDWYTEDIDTSSTSSFGYKRQGEKVYMRCTKCGYHQRHWKAFN